MSLQTKLVPLLLVYVLDLRVKAQTLLLAMWRLNLLKCGAALYLFGWAGPSVLAAAEWQNGPGYRSTVLSLPAHGHTGFALLNSAQTGITFSNLVPYEMHLTNHVLLDG